MSAHSQHLLNVYAVLQQTKFKYVLKTFFVHFAMGNYKSMSNQFFWHVWFLMVSCNLKLKMMQGGADCQTTDITWMYAICSTHVSSGCINDQIWNQLQVIIHQFAPHWARSHFACLKNRIVRRRKFTRFELPHKHTTQPLKGFLNQSDALLYRLNIFSAWKEIIHRLLITFSSWIFNLAAPVPAHKK
jgi:hypothetical protein